MKLYSTILESLVLVLMLLATPLATLLSIKEFVDFEITLSKYFAMAWILYLLNALLRKEQ